INTHTLPLGITRDSLKIITNDPVKPQITFYFELLIVNPGKITISVFQNPVLDRYFEFILNDSLGQIDSLEFYINNELQEISRPDTYTYIGKKEISLRQYSLKAKTYSFAGEMEISREMSVAFAKAGSEWAATEPGSNFSILAKSGAVQRDRHLIMIDSTLFSPEIKSGSYCIGVPGTPFEKAPLVQIKHQRDDAIWFSADGEIWRELPTLQKEDRLIAWAEMQGFYKIGEKNIVVPEETKLSQNYPNPFNYNTVIPFDLGFFDGPGQRVAVHIYNIRGQKVATITDRYLSVGHYEWRWGGLNHYGQQIASGVYFVKLVTGNGAIKTMKMVLLK
ncbi:MAG TPA: T9SS type A sorting domain-containing protein, partial [Candidatus Marinimicrobia bacterium]|nr:T9SS type A sorting domain-containing protein [Candidatus Neomarinimicrobiota bacterium]